MRGGPPENSGFGAVRVDDVGPDLAQEPHNVSVALPVAPGMNFAPQLGNDPQVEPALAGPFDQAAFRPDGRAGDEHHVVLPEMVLVVDRQQRIFLGASENEAGDDVHDLHQNSNSINSRAISVAGKIARAACRSMGSSNGSCGSKCVRNSRLTPASRATRPTADV